MTEGQENDKILSEGEVAKHNAQCLHAVYHGQLTAVGFAIHTGSVPQLCTPCVSKYAWTSLFTDRCT